MLIGIFGNIGSSKDTVADLIIKLDPTSHWVKKTLAEPLKALVATLTGFTIEDLDNRDIKNGLLPEEWDEIQGSYTIDGNTYYETHSSVEEFNENLPSNAYFEKITRVPITVRKLLVDIALACRSINKNIWTNKIIREYNDALIINPDTNWIVSDCKHKDQVQAILQQGGICFEVKRPNSPDADNANETSDDVSDLKLPIIWNDSDLKTLEELITKEVIPQIKLIQRHG